MGHDGATATATHLSNLHTTPIEILESEFPCRITRFDLVPDSGGAGQWRGGLAMRREYELLEDATVIRRFNKTRFPPKGVAGGQRRRARPLRGAARHASRSSRRRPRRASRCGGRTFPAAERGRRRLRRSGQARPQGACARCCRGLCLAGSRQERLWNNALLMDGPPCAGRDASALAHGPAQGYVGGDNTEGNVHVILQLARRRRAWSIRPCGPA